MPTASALKKLLAETFLEAADALETGRFGRRTRVGLPVLGSEHGPEEVIRGGRLAEQNNPDLEVVYIGPDLPEDLKQIPTDLCVEEGHRQMEKMLDAGELDAAVAMHYNFPIGVATVGRVVTPGQGREMFLATTTGTAATNRVEAMIYNALYGLAVAKASGIKEPTVGILNVDGARQVERLLLQMAQAGYPINFAETVRADGGSVMRGNDLLVGAPDVMVSDTLTGNILMKIFSSYTTGGAFEGTGYGYGPGVGPGYGRIINIISRASGAPVIANSIAYAAAVAQGELGRKMAAEWEAAQRAGLKEVLGSLQAVSREEAVEPPPAKTVTEEIAGIDVLEVENAAQALWATEIYAETGMGCTGPVILVAPEDLARAREILQKRNYIGV
jgi:hypothetical protein